MNMTWHYMYYDFWRALKFGHDFPQVFPTYSANGFGYINEGGTYIYNHVMVGIFLLELFYSCE